MHGHAHEPQTPEFPKPGCLQLPAAPRGWDPAAARCWALVLGLVLGLGLGLPEQQLALEAHTTHAVRLWCLSTAVTT